MVPFPPCYVGYLDFFVRAPLVMFVVCLLFYAYALVSNQVRSPALVSLWKDNWLGYSLVEALHVLPYEHRLLNSGGFYY
jgi:hypothetical protein